MVMKFAIDLKSAPEHYNHIGMSLFYLIPVFVASSIITKKTLKNYYGRITRLHENNLVKSLFQIISLLAFHRNNFSNRYTRRIFLFRACKS